MSGLIMQGQPETIIYLRISFEPQSQQFKVDLEEKRQGEEITLQRYIPTRVCLTTLRSLSQEIYSILYRSAHFSEKGINGIMERLQKAGRQLYDSVFPLEIKERLATTCSRNMHLTIDDSLVGIPWELLYDGEDFFCLKFNMGRKVYTQHPGIQPKIRDPGQKLKILIIADPRNDLPKSYQEGLLLSQKLETWRDSVEVYLGTSYIDTKKISREIFYYDIIHYAGHAIYDHENPNLSGWLLEDGVFTAQDILQLSGGKNSFPGLIFSNACRSGKTSEWSGMEDKNGINTYAFDLVNAFLRCGVKHYIGTFQVVRDLSSNFLASNFYNFMVQSCSVGESLRRARLELINQYGGNNPIWAYYMLYGDPTICYLRPRKDTILEKDKGEPALQVTNTDRRKRPETSTTGQPIDGHACMSPFNHNGTKTRMGDHPGNETPLQGSIHENGNIEDGKDKDRDRDQKNKDKDIKNGKKYKAGKGLEGWMPFAFKGVLLILLLFIGISLSKRFILNPEPPSPKYNNYDPLWEEEKWRVSQEILDKLKQRYDEGYKDRDSLANSFSDKTSEENGPLTICIMPAIPQGRMKEMNQQMTEEVIEELNLFWSKQPGFKLVERDRLIFVLNELKLATFPITEKKVQFALDKVLGARGVLFVRVFRKPGRLLPSFFGHRKKVFLRFVDTESTAVEAYEKGYFTDDETIEKVSQNLGERIKLSLLKRYNL